MTFMNYISVTAELRLFCDLFNLVVLQCWHY